MTVDIASLGIRIDSSDARTAARDMENFRGAGARAEQQVSALDVASRKAAQALQLLGVGAGVGAIIRMADEYTKYTAQLKLATQSQREYSQAVDDVRRIAKDAQQDLAATGTLYARISNGTRELGVEQKRVAAITETVNLALKVSGATAQESASAQLQLSQAFASGTLRGEEFNAVNEAAPRLMKALADGIGVPIGALKDMASNGEITSKVMAQVLPQALEQLRDEAKQVQTIAGAFTVLKNNVLEFVGTQAQASGTVSLLTGGIALLAENLDVLVGVLSVLTAVKVANWLEGTISKISQTVVANRALVAANLATAQSEFAAAAAADFVAQARVLELRAAVLAADGNVALAITTNGLIPAEANAARTAVALADANIALGVATRAAAGASSALQGAIAFLGGPIGAVVTVLGVAATAWSVYGNRADEANRKAAGATESSTAEIIFNLEKQNEKMRQRIELAKKAGLADAASVGGPEVERAARLLKEINDIKAQGENGNQLQLINVTEIYDELTAAMKVGKDLKAEMAQYGQEAKSLVDIRERLTGVNGQYIKDLKTLQAARDAGAVGEKEYISLTSQLATETWKSSEAGKAAIAATNKSAEAYKTLISSIHEATATNKLELAAGIDATDAQKARIKLDQELASGKVKLSTTQLASVRAALAEQDASEKALKSQRSVAAAIVELNEQRRQDYATAAAEAAANEQAAATFGLTKAQIEALTVARLEDRLAHAADLELTVDDIAQTERLIAAKKRSVDALTKGDALAYIKQLTDENKRFSADSIIDERARAAALLESDADVWRKRIALAGAGTEQQKQLQQQFDIWYRDQSLKPMLDEQREAVKKYDDVFREGFADMLNHGKSGWKSFTTSLITTFKTTVADQIYKMLAQPFVVKMVGSLLGVTGAGTAAAQSAAGSAGGSAATSMLGTAAGSLFGAGGLSGSLMAGAGWLTGSTTFGGALSAGASLIGTGTMGGIASGLGVMAGALGPIALGVAAVLTLAKKWDSSGTIHTGGAASASASGASNIDATTLGLQRINTAEATNQLTSQLASSIVSILDSTATTFGKTAGYTAATAFADDTSKDGAWGALIISNLNGIVSQWGDASSRWAPKVFADGEAGQKEYLASISTSVRAALDGIGLPAWAKEMLDSLGSAPALEDLAKVVDTINATQATLVTMGQRLTGFASLTDAAVSALIKASGGFEQLTSNASAYYDAFYSDAEKTAVVTKQIGDALAAVGLQMPATRDGYRALVEQELALGEAGAPAVAVLLANAQAFAQIVPAAESAASAVTSIVDAANSAYESAQSAVQSAYEKQRSALQDIISQRLAEADATQKLINSLKLSDLSDLSPEQKYLEAQRQFDAAAAGEEKNAAAQALLQASRDYNGSTEAFSKDYAKVQAALAIQVASQRSAASTAQKELAALDDLAENVLGVGKNVDSLTIVVRDFEKAALELGVAMLTLANANAAAGKPDTGNLGGKGTQAIDSALNGIYKAQLGRDADAAGLAFWEQQVKNGATYDQVEAAIKGSDEYKAIHGSHANGLAYVPFDGYRAELHRGERVQTAAQVVQGDKNGAETVALLKEVIAELRSDKTQRGAVGVATLKKLDVLAEDNAKFKRELQRA